MSGANESADTGRQQIPLVFSSKEPVCSEIVIQKDLLAKLGAECRQWVSESRQVLLVTDEFVAELYLPLVTKQLEMAGFNVTTVILPSGETSKSMAGVEQVLEAARQNHLTRKDVFIALGGGVIGDLTGFCASVWHRGTPVIQIPTTLIAQVDAAIGGKTAINLNVVKNAVGSFHQPRAVLIDPAVLLTLPERQLSAGLAEVIKYGLLETTCTGESGFFEWLLSEALNPAAALPEMIRRCCRIKAAVVTQDETETLGLRQYLNLGHTFAHAYESLSRYSLLHGEAVAIGLWKAAQVSEKLGQFPSSHLESLAQLLRQCGLWANVGQALCFPAESLLNRMRYDKKNLNRRLRLILPDQVPGRVSVREDVPEPLILDVFSNI